MRSSAARTYLSRRVHQILRCPIVPSTQSMGAFARIHARHLPDGDVELGEGDFLNRVALERVIGVWGCRRRSC